MSERIHHDHRGLGLTAADAGAVGAFDALTSAYLGMRTDVFAAAPGMALAHCLKDAFLMLASDRKFDAAVEACIAAAAASNSMRGATAREKGHLAALRAWRAGDLAGAAARLEAVLVDHPLDIVALRLAHYIHLYLSDPRVIKD
ncbi:MAG: hypothetical protein QF450_08640 [Rhodospirillales bacterium]|jgi:hypothetical protein|nr:hypothetical protein [Rhodospirillales bacterium]HJO73516.1 hypothetical protein [Rhodospirillales bacterium]